MSKQETIISIDIGSNSVHGIIAQFDQNLNKLNVLNAQTVPSNTGIKEGVVIGIQEASNSIKTLFARLEKDNKADKILVAVRGGLVNAFNSEVSLDIDEDDEEIKEKNIEDLYNKVRASKSLKSTHEIIEIIPNEYVIDGQDGIYNPAGMSCKEISLRAFVVSATKNNIKNIANAVGYDSSTCYGYTTLAKKLLSNMDKDLGCVLVDIGAASTGVVVYNGKKVQCVFEVPGCGSDLLTRDIIKKLRVSQKSAKEIKETYGTIFDDGQEDISFEYTYAGEGGEKQTFSKKELSQIIRIEMDYILHILKEELEKRNITMDTYSGGIILTGAGIKLPGMAKAFEQTFNCVTKIANFTEEDISIDENVLASQVYTTCIAVLLDNFDKQTTKNEETRGLFGKLRGFFKESF